MSHIVDTTLLRIFPLPEDYKGSEKAICMTKPHKYRHFHLKTKYVAINLHAIIKSHFLFSAQMSEAVV